MKVPSTYNSQFLQDWRRVRGSDPSKLPSPLKILWRPWKSQTPEKFWETNEWLVCKFCPKLENFLLGVENAETDFLIYSLRSRRWCFSSFFRDVKIRHLEPYEDSPIWVLRRHVMIALASRQRTSNNVNTFYKNNHFPTFLPLPNSNGMFRIQPYGEQQFASGTETDWANALGMVAPQHGQCLLVHCIPHMNRRSCS